MTRRHSKTPPMTLITTTADLKALCDRLTGAEFVTVDTEFMREKTYWSKLCLIQLAGPNEAAAIDPLAPGIDLTPLYDFMNDGKTLKVIHGGRQDVEIFYHDTGKIPSPLFDTQIAAMVCGFGDQVSYGVLVHDLTGEQIDKGSRFTDWSTRPLSDRQIHYGLADVLHLRLVYEKLKKRIDKFQRMEWVAQEMAELCDPKTYENPPEDAWHRIKLHAHRPRMLGILREICAWREHEARRINIPRGRFIKDEALAEIAGHPPTTVEALSRIRSLNSGFAEGSKGQDLLNIIKHAMNLPEADCPKIEKKPHLPPGLAPIIDLLRVLLKMKCDEHFVAPKLLASAHDLEMIAAFDNADVKALKGWRYELFGKDALELKTGKLALSIEKKQIKVIRV